MKAIGWLIGIVLLVIVGLGVYLVMNSGSLLKTAVETLGSEYLGVDVRLNSAELKLTEGTGELRGLTIGNPDGFDGPHAFSLASITLGLDPLGQSESLIVVENIAVDGGDLAIIATGMDTNLQAIMANLEGDAPSGSAPESDAESADAESGDSELKVIIEKFSFTNAQTSLNSDLLDDAAVQIRDIHLEGIGKKSQGVTIREALTQLLQPIVKASTDALAREGLNVDEIKADAEQRLDEELNKQLGTDLQSLSETDPSTGSQA